MTDKVSDRLIQFAPLLRVFLAMSGGIIVAHIPQLQAFNFFALFLLSLSVAIVFSLTKKVVYIQTITLFFSIFCFGAWWYQSYIERNSNSVARGECEYAAVVCSQPIERHKVIMFDMVPTDGIMKGKRVRVSILKDTIRRRYKNIELGQGIYVKSQFNNITLTGKDTDGYSKWLINNGYSATTFVLYKYWRPSSANINDLSTLKRIRLRGLLLRDKVESKLKTSSLSADAYAIVAAMTLGNKTTISPETYRLYSQSGVAHILALSGMHLAIISLLLRMIFRSRRFSILNDGIILFAIWYYVILVGTPLSAVRAAIMLSVILIADMMSCESFAINSLSLAGIILLLNRPTAIFDIGFQLSFASVFFILLLADSFTSLFYFPKNLFGKTLKTIWTMTVVSTVAQLGTLPLIMHYFGRSSIYFLLSNFIAIPAAYVIIISTTLMLLLWSWSWFSNAMAAVLNLAISKMDQWLSSISSLPMGDMGDCRISFTMMVLMYIVEFSLIILWFSYRKKKNSN